MASIVRRRQLRTGTGGFGADTAALQDIWLIEVDEQIDQFELLTVWVADGGLPRPKTDFKVLGAEFVVCDRIEAEVAGTQRYIWRVTVQWKELAGSEPQTQSLPTPTTNSADPTDWSPTVTRRPVTFQEPAESLFYEDGYTGEADTTYAAKTAADPPERSSLTNSAMVPFRDNLPPHQRKQSLYTLRWLRATVPDTLLDFELMLNSEEVTFSHRGFERTWAAKTAKIESIQLTQTQWGTQQLWEIVIEILHDEDGHYITTLDHGMMEQYFPGETYGGSPLADCKTVLIQVDGKQVPEPVLLNGSGKRLDCDLDAKYGRWRDFALTDFNTVPLLEDLVA